MEAHHALSALCHLWIRGLVTVYHLNAPKKGALKNVSANIVGHGRVRQWTGILSSFSTFCGRPEQPPTLYLTTFYPRGSSRGQYVKCASQSMTTWTYNPLSRMALHSPKCKAILWLIVTRSDIFNSILLVMSKTYYKEMVALGSTCNMHLLARHEAMQQTRH